jgi:transcriptional regulator with XRE-family HTH domain
MAHVKVTPLARGIRHAFDVPKNDTRAKHILARNLIKLMDRPGAKFISTRQLAAQSKGELTYRTVARIRNAEVNPTLDHIEALAKAFVLQPWQLLVPHFDAPDPPHLAFTQAEKEAYDRMQSAIAEFRALQTGKPSSK